MKTALSIAGSDSSGGAGIQADIKTMMANDVYAMTCITALTAQNTTGVSAVMNVTPEFLAKQLDAVFTDIFPDAVKVGMVPDAELANTIAERLAFYEAKNIVVDPVMVSTSGSVLSGLEAVKAITTRLFPLATVITPNIPEAEVLSGVRITNQQEMERAAKTMYERYGCAVLLKGGHSVNDANDLLCSSDGLTWLYSVRIDNPNTHGTGCTLSSAIAAGLAKGNDLYSAIDMAKKYISRALAAGLDLGQGAGPLKHNV